MRSLLVPAVLISATALVLTACTADPPPPIESVETPVTTTTAPTSTGDPVVVAIDDVGIGFNPHLLADQSPANAAVSALVLPSPFRPVVSAVDPAVTTWEADSSLLVSAEVTSQDPFTITYQLRNDAQWSDSAPIAAEDFRYLWQQMISQPGVVDPAGYGLIDNIASSGGGKTVTVRLSSPYPNWERLFTDLLPSHLLKDSPGGFETGLSDTVPVSGGRFAIKSVDQGRDEILLERNDRFWGQPAKPDQILMRRGGTPAQLADSLRSRDAQIAQVRGGSAAKAQLSAIPGVRTSTVLQSRVLDVTLNGRVPMLLDPQVRRGIFGLLDPALLATVGAGTTTAEHRAAAQLRSPSDPLYVPTAPPALARADALALLFEAGYTYISDGVLGKDGVPLTFTIGVVENDDIAAAVAGTVADELASAGIDASVTSLPAQELYSTALADASVGAVVGWTRAGVDPATVLASRFGCPAVDSAPAVTPAPTDLPTRTDLPAPTVSSAPTSTPVAAEDDSDGVPSPSNISGLCVPELEPFIDGALRGTIPVNEVIARAEPQLWALATVLPVMQDSSIVAAVPSVAGVSLTGPLEVGIFNDASDWMRTPQ